MCALPWNCWCLSVWFSLREPLSPAQLPFSHRPAPHCLLSAQPLSPYPVMSEAPLQPPSLEFLPESQDLLTSSLLFLRDTPCRVSQQHICSVSSPPSSPGLSRTETCWAPNLPPFALFIQLWPTHSSLLPRSLEVSEASPYTPSCLEAMRCVWPSAGGEHCPIPVDWPH